MLGLASLFDFPTSCASAFACAVTLPTLLGLAPDLVTAFALDLALPFDSPIGLAIAFDLASARASALASVA